MFVEFVAYRLLTARLGNTVLLEGDSANLFSARLTEDLTCGRRSLGKVQARDAFKEFCRTGERYDSNRVPGARDTERRHTAKGRMSMIEMSMANTTRSRGSKTDSPGEQGVG